jgi:hypothetical protein
MESEVSGLDPLFITFDQLLAGIVGYLPTIASAGALLAAGFAVGLTLKVIVLRMSAAMSLLFSRATGTKRSGHVRLPWPLSVIFANVILWLTVVFFFAASARVIGLPGVADWIAEAARYIPNVIVAAMIVLGGYILASTARDALAIQGEQSQAFAGLVSFLINIIAALAALRQLGIDLVLVHSLLLIVVGAVFGGVAFAFGTGASLALNNIIAAYYVRRVYRRGQRVRVGAVEGEILDITPTAVIVDTRGGRAMVPAMKFNQDVSVLLGQEEASDGA